MNSDQHFFDIDFPTKLIHKKGLLRNGWITKGIKIPSKKMKILNMLVKQPKLSEDVLMYIAEYKMIYRSVIREAKIRENDKYILKMQKINLEQYG